MKFHPLLIRALRGEYAVGIQLYEANPSPSATDDRYFGWCLCGLHEFRRAVDVLLRSRSQGCAEAGIELAMAYRLLGEFGKSAAAILALPTPLPPLDGLLALRERGVMAFARGQYAAALRLLEDAWALHILVPGGHHLAAGLAQALAQVAHYCGNDHLAEHYLVLALKTTDPLRKLQVLHIKVLTEAYLGRFAEAAQSLASARRRLSGTPSAAALLHYSEAVLARAMGDTGRAVALFGEASTLASDLGERDTVFYAELHLCALETSQHRLDRARGHLARARSLVSGEKQQAHFLLREGAYLIESGPIESGLEQAKLAQLGANAVHKGREDQGAALVAEAAAQFTRLGMAREAAWAAMHLAEGHLRAGRIEDARQAAAEAAHIRYSLGHGEALAFELNILPRLSRFLASEEPGLFAAVLIEDWKALRPPTAAPIRIVTLGRSSVMRGDVPVRFQLRRTAELLVYVLLRPHQTRSEILNTLMPEESAGRAVNYFHQLRYELAKTLPGLRMTLRPVDRTYSVTAAPDGRPLDIHLDIADLTARLGAGENTLEQVLDGYTGTFLPEAESEWVRTERARLEHMIVRAGLREVERLYEQGEHQRCLSLVRRLTGIDPYDAVLNEFLLDCTLATEGLAAARCAYAHLQVQYAVEFGEPSLELEGWSRRVLPVQPSLSLSAPPH